MEFTLSRKSWSSALRFVMGLSAVLIFQTAVGQEFTSSPQQLEVMAGSNVTLTCQLTNLGNLNVFWLHKRSILSFNRLVMHGDGRYFIRGRYNLVLTNVTSQDDGDYTCQVSTEPEQEQLSTLKVIDKVPAEITQFPKSSVVETTVGNPVELTCGATGKPSPNVTWSGKEIEIKPAGGRTGNAWTSSLVISSVQPQHDGVYTCTAFNGVGRGDSNSLRLKVLYAPVFQNETTVVYTGPGQEAYLPCVVSAQPEPQVTWFHNGSRLGLRELPQHKEIVVEGLDFGYNYGLHIVSVEEEDLGKYVCQITNIMGQATTAITLTAQPSRSVVLSSRMGDYSDLYTLKWSVESYVTPLHYRLVFRQEDNSTEREWREMDVQPSAEGQGSEVHEVSVIIPDLSHDTSYEVMIRAHNSYGWGENSDRFTFTTNSAGVTAPSTATFPSTNTTEQEYKSGINGSSSVGTWTCLPWTVILFLLTIAT